MNPAEHLDTVAKAQYVRLVDVFILGPALLYTASVLPPQHRTLRAFLTIAGVGTVFYNARNFLRIQQLIAADTSGRLASEAWARLP